MTSDAFITALSTVALPQVFNPYRENCEKFDNEVSATIRRHNLKLYIDSFLGATVDSIWLGRDCGYRGARRTGIAFTDEPHLQLLKREIGLPEVKKATAGPIVKERTATEVWKALNGLSRRVFLWNVFPFHPHVARNPMSNRCHTAREFAACEHLLRAIIALVRPTRIIAIGLDAHRDLKKLGLPSLHVRHPSYGGHKEFAAGIKAIHEDASNQESYDSLLPTPV